jgi:hypothetical protein
VVPPRSPREAGLFNYCFTEETMYPLNNLSIVITFIAIYCPVSTLHADVYRCVNDNGHISYQQIRCHQNSSPLTIRHGRTGWTGLRSGERALLDNYQKRDSKKKPEPPGNSATANKKSSTCKIRKARLDAVRGKLRRGYNVRESEKLHQQRSDHADYLRQFCSR